MGRVLCRCTMMSKLHVEAIKLSNRPIVGELRYTKPRGQLVVVCHGYQSSSNHPALVAITEGLSKAGHATFKFDFTSKGGLSLESQVADIKAIIDHFKSYDEIILLAGSFGALSASISAAMLPNIAGLITLNGFFGTNQLGPTYSSTFKKFKIMTVISPSHRKTWRFYKRQFQPARIKAPALVVYSKADEVVSMIQSQDFYKQLTNAKQLEVLETADHNLTSAKDVNRIIIVISEWLHKIQK